MNTFKHIYRVLDQFQQQLAVKITLTVIVLAVCGGVFGSLLVTSYGMDSQRQKLLSTLEAETLQAGDPHAVSLRDQGTVTIDGRMYRLTILDGRQDEIFDEDGYIAAPSFVVEDLLRGEIPRWVPTWLLDQPATTWLLAISATLWLLLVIWLQITVPFLLTLVGTLVPVGVLWYFGREQAMVAIAGMGLLTFTFLVLTRAFMFLFDQPNQILAVAHTVLKEASRRRISLSFIVILLVMLPLLPVWLDPDTPLRYQLQTFISRSLSLTFVVAACMTVFLSCATVAFEIRDRQIWQLMTKPLNRFNYLLGKWLGVVSVNLILLTVAGVSIFTFIQYLRTQPVAPGVDGQLDAVQVDHAVLTARQGMFPVYDMLQPEQIRERVLQRIEDDPELRAANPGFAEQRELADEIVQNHLTRQRSIPPGRQRSYTFTGLEQAREFGVPLTLRYRFYILESDQHATFEAGFEFNHDPQTRRIRTYVPSMPHILLIGPDIVREDGTLTVTIANMFEGPPGYRAGPGDPGSINFDLEDFELLYKVANFEGNFLRAVLLLWVKLAFLAMLGICCATFLSFSVACLLTFTIFIAGTMAPYLAGALEEYYMPEFDRIDWTDIGLVLRSVFQTVIRFIASGLVFALEAFGAYQPTQQLVEGRFIGWRSLAGAIATLGLFWSGLALFFGYLVLRSRQLAIYSGQG